MIKFKRVIFANSRNIAEMEAPHNTVVKKQNIKMKPPI